MAALLPSISARGSRAPRHNYRRPPAGRDHLSHACGDGLNPPPDLNRTIGLWQAAALVAGIMIGASIFLQPAEIGRHVRGVPSVLAGWLPLGAISFSGALVLAPLASAFSPSGGVLTFVEGTL